VDKLKFETIFSSMPEKFMWTTFYGWILIDIWGSNTDLHDSMYQRDEIIDDELGLVFNG